MGYKYLPCLSPGKYIERIKEGMRSVQWIGTHSMPMTDDEQGGPKSSGISTESDIGLNITRYGNREVYTRLIKGNNLGNRNVNKSQVSVLWNYGLWAHIE